MKTLRAVGPGMAIRCSLPGFPLAASAGFTCFCGSVVRHCGPVGIDSRAVALAVLSVVAAVVLGFAAGVRAGALALAALAGFVPAVVWELTRDLRERNARVAGRRKAALKAFVPAVAPPAAGGPVAGSPGEHSAAWYLRPEAQVVAFRPRPGLSQLREWCVAGGRQIRRRQYDIRLRRVRRQRGELH
jgi:hypothetical protein